MSIQRAISPRTANIAFSRIPRGCSSGELEELLSVRVAGGQEQRQCAAARGRELVAMRALHAVEQPLIAKQPEPATNLGGLAAFGRRIVRFAAAATCSTEAFNRSVCS